jgi:hypothetical protein
MPTLLTGRKRGDEDLRPSLLSLTSLLLCAALLACGSREKPPGEGPASRKAVTLTDLPTDIDPRARYLFYLHGQIVEDQGPRPEHPRLGIYEYEAIRDTLAARGLVVISEARKPGTDVWTYARKVTGQVERLLTAGVPPERIAVAGHSKGGAIAILTSSFLQNEHVNYIFLACCGGWMATSPDVKLSGRILSLYDSSDELAGSCQEAFDSASKPLNTKEIKLDTGLGHGAFYRPMRQWIDPMTEWILAAKER